MFWLNVFTQTLNVLIQFEDIYINPRKSIIDNLKISFSFQNFFFFTFPHFMTAISFRSQYFMERKARTDVKHI